MNKFAELKKLEEVVKFTRESVSEFYTEYGRDTKLSRELWKDNYSEDSWKNKLASCLGTMSELEIYISSKRKRSYVPELYANPFFIEYTSDKSPIKKDGQFHMKKNKLETKWVNGTLKGRSLVEYNKIRDMIMTVNKSKSINKDDKMILQLSPIKVSSRGEMISNAFAMSITFGDGSICCFYYISGRFNILLNT